MNKLKISVLDADSLKPDDLDFSPWYIEGCELAVYPSSSPSEVLERCSESDIVILNKIELDRSLFAEATRLKLVACVATGTNNIDIQAAHDAGVRVVNSINYGTQSVVQHTLALILNLAGNVQTYSRDVAQGIWAQSEYFCSLNHPIRELTSMTLGIIGYGVLGREVARQAALLGMKVQVAQSLLRSEPQQDRVSLERLLKTSDVVTIHCPLSIESKGLISTKELTMMKPNALLINCARGGIIDESALAEALKNNRLGGVGLDVLASEPPQHPHPLTTTGHPNVIITPHMAWGSQIARQNLIAQTAEDITAFIQGEELKREVTV